MSHSVAGAVRRPSLRGSSDHRRCPDQSPRCAQDLGAGPAIGTSARIVKPPLICPECVQLPSTLRQSPGGHDHGNLYQTRSRIHPEADQDCRSACRGQPLYGPSRPDPRPTTWPGACARSTVPTTISFPARSSGARPTARSLNGSRRCIVPPTARLSIPMALGPAPAMPTAPNYNPSNNPQLRSSSTRACARSPTCSSTRRWAIRQPS